MIYSVEHLHDWHLFMLATVILTLIIACNVVAAIWIWFSWITIVMIVIVVGLWMLIVHNYRKVVQRHREAYIARNSKQPSTYLDTGGYSGKWE